MDAERTGRKVVDPGRFNPDTPKRGTSQHPDRRLSARAQRAILRERVVPLLATIAGLPVVLAVAMAGTAGGNRRAVGEAVGDLVRRRHPRSVIGGQNRMRRSASMPPQSGDISGTTRPAKTARFD